MNEAAVERDARGARVERDHPQARQAARHRGGERGGSCAGGGAARRLVIVGTVSKSMRGTPAK
eukprot:scaffold3658_cov66-Phaeocystis_antarctica.AAC.3